MVRCPRCGQENPDGFRLCGMCGAPLPPATAPREERKVVTALFCDLVGSTAQAERLDPEDVRTLLSRYHRRVRRDLEHFGGTVEKFIGDAVMALFGAPVAHEDDPERAVRAALAIRDWALDEGDLQVRIGLTTGEALIALGANPQAGEGMASGDVVNTAARLERAAPDNGIVVDETTYRATERAIGYREQAPVEAKGKAEPIPIWQAVEAKARFGVDVEQGPATPLVGRQRELILLTEALARTREESEPQLLTLVGVPGIGKSRLVHELSEVVDRDPELIFWRQGRCLPYGEGISFWALGEMVKAQAGILETDPPDSAVEKLEQAVGTLVAERADWVQRHLRPLIGAGRGTELAGDWHGEAFAAWRAFFEALADQGPTVLAFEDLQWADEGLLDFVDELVDWATDVPLFVLCTARPELLDRRPGWGGGKPNAVTISLPALSEDETAKVLHAVLGQAVLAADVQRAVLERAGGNPLYAEEFSRLVRERRDGGDLALPETVQGIVAARLDQLPADEKQLLQDAAVLGKVFWVGAVERLRGIQRSTVESALRVLDRREFVRRARRTSVAEEIEYAFRHIVVRDVVYAQIPRASRAEKHRLAAEWIGSLGRPEDHAEMLAYHYLEALQYAEASGQRTDELARAGRLSLREAGERALKLNAFHAALRFFERASALWPRDDPERPLVLFHHGAALFWARDVGADVLAEARDALLAADDRERAAEAEVMLGELEWRRARGDAAHGHFDRARELVEKLPTSRSGAYVLAQLSRFLMLANKNDEAIHVGRRALAVADELGLDGVRAHVLNNIGVARTSLGDVDGLRDIEASVEIAEAIESPEAQRAYVNLAAMVFQVHGNLHRSRELHEKSLAVAERFGYAAGVRWVRAELVLDDYWLGHWEPAYRGADEFIAESEAGSPHYMEAGCRLVRTSIQVARGNESEALADVELALANVRATKDPQNLFPTLGWSARILSQVGHSADARSLIRDFAAALSDEANVPSGWCFDLVVVLTDLGRANEALALLERASASRLGQAARAYARGDFARAADVLGEIGMLTDEAHARLRSGRNADLRRALAFYRSVGATRYIADAESLLAASVEKGRSVGH